MIKNMRGLALFALVYIAIWPVEYSVAQDQPRARELSRSGPVRVFRKRESPVLFSQQGEVRFQKAYVHQDGSILADGYSLDLYGAMLIRRDRICASEEGARWTCGQRAYMALRALLAGRPITRTAIRSGGLFATSRRNKINPIRPSASRVRLGVLIGLVMKTLSGTLPTRGSSSLSCPPLTA